MIIVILIIIITIIIIIIIVSKFSNECLNWRERQILQFTI